MENNTFDFVLRGLSKTLQKELEDVKKIKNLSKTVLKILQKDFYSDAVQVYRNYVQKDDVLQLAYYFHENRFLLSVDISGQEGDEYEFSLSLDKLQSTEKSEEEFELELSGLEDLSGQAVDSVSRKSDTRPGTSGTYTIGEFANDLENDQFFEKVIPAFFESVFYIYEENIFEYMDASLDLSMELAGQLANADEYELNRYIFRVNREDVYIKEEGKIYSRIGDRRIVKLELLNLFEDFPDCRGDIEKIRV
jgi:hypothetical protein